MKNYITINKDFAEDMIGVFDKARQRYEDRSTRILKTLDTEHERALEAKKNLSYFRFIKEIRLQSYLDWLEITLMVFQKMENHIEEFVEHITEERGSIEDIFTLDGVYYAPEKLVEYFIENREHIENKNYDSYFDGIMDGIKSTRDKHFSKYLDWELKEQ